MALAMEWRIEHAVTAAVTPVGIWALWSEIDTWPLWDDDFERVTLDGPFVVGSRGALHMPGNEPIPFVLTIVEPGSAFEDVTEFGGATLRFFHRLDAVAAGTRITHGVEITGPGTEAVAGMIGENLARGMVKAVATLAKLAAGEPVVPA